MPAATSFLAATALIGGGLTAFGQLKEGEQKEEAGRYNAQIAEQEASLIRQKSILNEYRQRKALVQTTGEQVSLYAKAGVAFTGSPLNVIADSIANAELDISIGKYNAESEAKAKESEARLSRYYGSEDLALSKTKAMGTLLTSGSTAAMRLSVEKGKTKIG